MKPRIWRWYQDDRGKFHKIAGHSRKKPREGWRLAMVDEVAGSGKLTHLKARLVLNPTPLELSPFVWRHKPGGPWTLHRPKVTTTIGALAPGLKRNGV